MKFDVWSTRPVRSWAGAGPTMADDLARYRWRMNAHARTLALLHKRLHVLTPPSWLKDRADVVDGASIVDLDLHLFNVMLSRRGPIVIDWANCARGSGAFDAALTYMMVSTADTRALWNSPVSEHWPGASPTTSMMTIATATGVTSRRCPTQ
jgi:hypothetical protein